MHWFDVDRQGLAKLLARKGKEFLLFELIQNAWDQDARTVDIHLTRMPGSRTAVLSVEDDDPEGFKDLAHAWTLFAESTKKGDAGKRGRFNLGEKLVLALCEQAEITTTTGGVRFDAEGRHRLRRRRERGSKFHAEVRLTYAEQAECERAVRRLIPPAGIITRFNDVELSAPAPLATFEASLATVLGDEEGVLRQVTRKTAVRVFQPAEGEVGWLFEMGIPVVETGDAYHVDVGQKVPVSFERDNVPPGYLRILRTHLVNALHQQLPPVEASSLWVRDALAHRDISEDAVRSVVTARFGDKAVTFDPSDPEANKLAVSKGYVVVTGGQLSADEWRNVKAAGALLPAGQVTPSPKPFSPGGETLKVLEPERWSAAERGKVAAIRNLAGVLLGGDIAVTIAVDFGWPFAACFGGRHLTINKSRVGSAFFERAGFSEKDLSLLIHEFGHHYSGDHLDAAFHDALTDLGGRLAVAVARDPSLLGAGL